MIVYTDKFLLSRARKRAKLAEAQWLCIAYKNMVCIHIRYRHETKRNEKKVHKNNIHLHLLTATEHNTRNNNNNGRRICGEREQKLVFRHHVIFVQYFCQALIRSHSNSISLVLRCASSVSVSYFFCINGICDSYFIIYIGKRFFLSLSVFVLCQARPNLNVLFWERSNGRQKHRTNFGIPFPYTKEKE